MEVIRVSLSRLPQLCACSVHESFKRSASLVNVFRKSVQPSFLAIRLNDILGHSSEYLEAVSWKLYIPHGTE